MQTEQNPEAAKTAIEQALPAAEAAGEDRPAFGETDPYLSAVTELLQLYRQGRLPEGFDPNAACADRAFAELLLDMPVYAAVRVYMAEQGKKRAGDEAKAQLSMEMQRRAALPRSTRPNMAASPAPDYMNLSSAAFHKLAGELKRAARNGQRPRL